LYCIVYDEQLLHHYICRMRLLLWYSIVLISSCMSDNAPQQISSHSDTLTVQAIKTVQIAVDDKNESAVVLKDTPQVVVQQQSPPLNNFSGMVDVQTICPAIYVDLKYSSSDNFLKMDVYGDLNKAYLQPDVANKLKQAQVLLEKSRPGFHLLVYDAARPLHIQQRMWDALRDRPFERSKYVSNPAQGGSLHNYGAAVDLTIADSSGLPLDMGTPFDYFGIEAHPNQETMLLSTGKLNAEQVSNRQLLRMVMYQAGFFGISSEWWHFNSCSRATAKMRYNVLQ
jgi:zinc D-Ala-D-Ala dipeptidase